LDQTAAEATSATAQGRKSFFFFIDDDENDDNE